MSQQDLIEQIMCQALERLLEIESSPKPSYSVDGQAVSWNEYRTQLRETITWCKQQLQADAPFEIHSAGYT